MFRTGIRATEFKNEPRAETANVPAHSSPQTNESFTVAPAESESASRPIAESAMIAREIREGTLSAFVGGSTRITGDISFKSLLRVDGFLSGRITSDEGTLVVAAAGTIEASVNVAVARIHGTVTGDIVCCERIELGAAAKVKGNIQAPTLIIEPGAVLDGLCRMTTQAAEPETVSEPQPAATEPGTNADAVTAPGIVAGESTVPEPAIAAPLEDGAKAPKIARKGNVVRAKPRRTRTKAATAKTVEREPAVGERATGAAG